MLRASSLAHEKVFDFDERHACTHAYKMNVI